MVVRNRRDGAKRLRRCLCESKPHFFCMALVRTNEEVRVIAEDRTCPTGTSALADHSRESFSDRGSHCVVVPDNGMIEHRFCFLVELTKFLSRGLDAFATMVDLTKILQFLFDCFGRPASARIV